MPYSHFHNWSFHTHHRQPKGGNHYNAVRRRQRPWRIGFVVVLIGSLACLAVFAGLRFDTQVKAVKTFVVGNAKEQSQRQEERAQAGSRFFHPARPCPDRRSGSDADFRARCNNADRTKRPRKGKGQLH